MRWLRGRPGAAGGRGQRVIWAARPASSVTTSSVASFAPVELEVTPLRSGRTVLAQRVAMSQEGRPVLDAMVWSVGEVEGLEHEDVDPPDVPDPRGVGELDRVTAG